MSKASWWNFLVRTCRDEKPSHQHVPLESKSLFK
jgi:hypothetical protein